jgi:rhomboid-like protein
MNHAPTVIYNFGLRNSKTLPNLLRTLQPCRTLHTSSSISTHSVPFLGLRTVPSLWCSSRPTPNRYPHNDSIKKSSQRVQGRLYSKGSDYGSLSENAVHNHPNKFNDLSFQEVKAMFGPGVRKKTANDLLRKLQKQRITGTLDHGINEPGINEEMATRALQWLRTEYPLDEDAAIVKRIELEEKEKEQQFIIEAEKLKNWHPQQSAQTDGLYGKPMVDVFAAQVRERKAAREKQVAEIRAKYTETQLIKQKQYEATIASTESAEWVKRYKEKAKLSKMLEPPQMSITRRLLPSLLMTVAIVTLCVLFASNYKPPPLEARLFPDKPPAISTIAALVGVNFAVFLLWRLPPLWRFMNMNFLLIPATPKMRTLVGSIFSHQHFSHFLSNMLWLAIIGPRCKFCFKWQYQRANRPSA